jgi:hypothetical protein
MPRVEKPQFQDAGNGTFTAAQSEAARRTGHLTRPAKGATVLRLMNFDLAPVTVAHRHSNGLMQHSAGLVERSHVLLERSGRLLLQS